MTIATKAETEASKRKTPERVADVRREFRTTYADATSPDLSETAWGKALLKRRLEWRAGRRISLAQAARCYAQIHDSYNEFRPTMIADLCGAFSNDGITATAAREYSVAIYLHVPDQPTLRQRVEEFVNEHFIADEVSWVEAETLRVWWD